MFLVVPGAWFLLLRLRFRGWKIALEIRDPWGRRAWYGGKARESVREIM